MSETNTKGERLPFPENGVCSCGSEEYTIHETGYSRTTEATNDDGTLHAFTDGWDDMSDSGDDEWVECNSCDLIYEVPENVEYD